MLKTNDAEIASTYSCHNSSSLEPYPCESQGVLRLSISEGSEESTGRRSRSFASIGTLDFRSIGCRLKVGLSHCG